MNERGPTDLDRLLAAFLKAEMKRRGMSHAQLARIIKVSKSTCQRLTDCESSATVQLLSRIRRNLRVRLSDIFRDK